MTSKKRRIRGPLVVAIFLTLTAAGAAGGYLVLRDHPTPGDIVDITNLDGKSAVLIRAPLFRSFRYARAADR